MTSTTTGTVNFEISGKFCTLTTINSILGTSNTTMMTMTGLPIAVQPATGTPFTTCLVENGGNYALGAASVSGANVEFYTVLTNSGSNPVGLQLASAQFASSGSKGVPAGWTMTYVLD
jgi:hypothetical protein